MPWRFLVSFEYQKRYVYFRQKIKNESDMERRKSGPRYFG